MEDGFIARVDKIFGSLGPSSSTTSSIARVDEILRSLGPSSSTTSSLPSPWSLSDAEMEKKEWNRERDTLDREDIPCSSSFDGYFSKEQRVAHKKKIKTLEFEGDLEVSEDDDDDDDEEDNEEKEDWEIRSSIGLDCTLDDEDEEDEFDKVAVGRENDRERIFMKDITDHGKYLNSHNVLPNSCIDHRRDPLADRLCARVDFLPDDDTLPVRVDLQVKVGEDGGNVKPILKRKKNKSDMKLAKRVKFDLGCEGHRDQELKTQSLTTVAYSTEIARVTEDTVAYSTEKARVTEDSSSVPEYTSGVPDYIRNPSKYTRYEFDSSSELSEESNHGACMDFLNMIRKSKTPESEGAVDLPKSITFTPKKKTGDTEMKHKVEDAFKEPKSRVEIPLGIAAGEELENEACAMDEDVQETTTADNSGSCRKPGRQYRAKISYDDSVS